VPLLTGHDAAVVERHTDAAHLNAIANHPAVYPWVRGPHEGPIDCTALLCEPGIYALMGEHGGVLFRRLQGGLYEAHSQYLPSGRGEWAVAASRQAMHWMFTHTDAAELITRCPDGNLGAKALARALARSVGGVLEFRSQRGWVKDGRIIPADVWRVTLQDWLRTAPGLEERGQWFHDRIEAEFARLGVPDLAHPDDPVHDRYVGAACEMLAGGQPIKGLSVYNRFATFGGYEPARLKSLDPLQIDIGNAVLAVADGDFTVTAVRPS
jgi:hypothetical protein